MEPADKKFESHHWLYPTLQLLRAAYTTINALQRTRRMLLLARLQQFLPQLFGLQETLGGRFR